MLINLLVTDRWVGREDHGELLDDADWAEIEAAVRRLDGHTYTSVSIEKVLADSDDNEGELHLSVAGGPEVFLVVFQAPGETERFATCDHHEAAEIDLVAGGQGVTFPSRVCVSLSTAVEAAREFARLGVAASSVRWIERYEVGL